MSRVAAANPTSLRPSQYGGTGSTARGGALAEGGMSALEKEQMLAKRKQAVTNRGQTLNSRTPEMMKFTWKKIPATSIPGVDMPEGRSGHVAFTLSSTDPRIFIHGGAADSKYFQDLYCFHTGLKKWMFAHTFNKPCNRAYLTTMLVQPDTELPKSQQVSRLMTYGGFNKGQLYGEVHMIDEWTVIKRGLKGRNEPLPVPRKKSDQPPPTAWTDIWRECDEVCGEIPLARCMHTATLVNGRHLVVFGGWHTDFVHDVYVLDVQTMVWEQKDCLMPYDEETQARHRIAPRAGHTAVLLPDRRLLVFGGQNKDGQRNDLLLLDLNKMEWFIPTPSGNTPTVRSGHSAVYHSGKVYIYGGWDGIRQRDDLHILTVEGDPMKNWRWEIFKLANNKVIGGLCGHTASMVNGQMYIMGGWSNGYFHNDVYTLEWGLPDDKRVKLITGGVAQGVAPPDPYAVDLSEGTGKQRLATLQNKLYSEQGVGEKQMAGLNVQVEGEIVDVMTDIAARKLRIMGENTELERKEKQRVAAIVAERRRQNITALLDEGYSMKEAIAITEKEVARADGSVGRLPEVVEYRPTSPDASAPPPASEMVEWHPSKAGRRRFVPKAPSKPEMTVVQRNAIFRNVDTSPYFKWENAEREYDNEAMQQDVLGTIAATGGLASCYDDKRRQKMLDDAARILSAQEGEEGALAAAMAASDARKVVSTHPDAHSTLKPPGSWAVPKKGNRPGRIALNHDVGTIENIRDSTMPVQVPQVANLPYPSDKNPKYEYTGLDGQLTVYQAPAPSNAITMGHAEKSVMPRYEEMMITEHHARMHHIPQGMVNTVSYMQAHMRGYLTRKQMRQHVAACTIQAHYRGYRARNSLRPLLTLGPQGSRARAESSTEIKPRARMAISSSVLPPL